MRKPTDIGTPRAKKNHEHSIGKLTREDERILREWEQRPCRWCDQPEGSPQRCHRCPKCNGEIMPHCYGCIHGDSLASCTCPRVRRPDSTRALLASNAALVAEVAALRRMVETLVEDAKKRPPR